MCNEDLVEWPFEIDADLCKNASEVCRAWGTTIEDMAAAFIRFTIMPENFPLVKSFLHSSQNYDERMNVSQQIIRSVLSIALKENPP